ncbi:MAG: double zinc ribbon domain-containing protein [Spirochaetaceae bacterium]
MSNRSRFYCENCGKEVRASAKVCPHCGRFFSAVRCPVCGFTGESRLFLQGCPSCGYAGATGQPDRPDSGFEVYDVESISGGEGASRRGRASPAGGGAAGRRRSAARGAPPWLYWLTLALLGLFFVIMAVIYMRL